MSRSIRKAFLGLGVLGVVTATGLGQPTSTGPLAPPSNGMRRVEPDWVALVNATVHVKPGEVWRHATVVCRDGRIVSVMKGSAGADGVEGTEDDEPARLPLGPRVMDCTNLVVYAGFIDPYVEVEAPMPAENPAAMHWNGKVTPQRSAMQGAGLPGGTAEALRRMGFGAAAIAPKGGVFRGTAALVSLGKGSEDPSAPKVAVYRDGLYQSVAFETGGGYPGSLMGAIALVRQTFADAAWQAGERARGVDVGPENALDALGEGQSPKPLTVFNADDELDALRAYKVAVEFSRPAVILGSGTEFRRLEAIAKDNLAYFLPVNFPKAPDASSIAKQEGLELRDLMTWEQAPTNPRRLAGAGVTFAFTTAKLRDRGEFLKNVRLAIRYGLKPEEALAALTTTPAHLLGVSGMLGTVEAGKRANLVIADGEMFAVKGSEKVKIKSVVVDSVVYEVTPPAHDLAGTWDVEIPGAEAIARSLVIGAESDLTVHRGEKSVKATKVTVSRHAIACVFDHEPLDGEVGLYAATASVERNAGGAPVRLVGTGVRPDGARFDWTATRRAPSLEGYWSVRFEEAGRAGPVLVFDGSNGLTFLDEVVDAAEKPVAARNVTWDGTRLAYEVDGAGGMTRVEATADLSAEPAVLKGTATEGDGRHAFTARRSKDHPMVGRWRVIRFDGKEKEAKDASQVFVEVKKAGKGYGVTIEFAGRAPADAAAGTAPTSFTIEGTEVSLKGTTLTYTYALAKLGMEGTSTDTVRLVGDLIEGSGTLPGDVAHTFVAAREEAKAEEDEEPEVPEAYGMPFGPYGVEAMGAQGTYVLTNATVWTGREVLEHAHVVIRGGTIAAVGTGDMTLALPAGDEVVTIDATGKHVTAGIIDCHSHTGISGGVNEGGQAVTAEVRIGDVTDPDSVDWYRQLASGVTSVNQLHGSANAIGGQSQTTKIRWGVTHPDAMHFEGAKAGIKFALGENPTGANDGRGRSRYPVTRMGVETLIRDRFTAAREYAAAKAAGLGVRRDLELEALAEVLAGTRLVHCHSYRQDEILMLSHVARDFGFKIGTYQHILEGYKVADVVRDFSGGGSGFADWWAYKVEVQDAIPYALPLMHEVGVVVSFNSDSAELVRRLNVEAAKAVKYGNEFGRISEIDAWNFVTLNPAKQLRIDDRVGTVEVGKDADVAVWSGPPLSSMSKCERTFVDGRMLFSLEADAASRALITSERQRLIQKALTEGKKRKASAPEAKTGEGAPGDAPAERPRRRRPTGDEASLDGLTAEQVETLRRLHLDALRSGRDPFHMPGVCGCSF